MLTYTFKITGMSCGHCKKRIEDAVSAACSASEVIVSLENNSLELHSQSPLVVEEIVAAIDDAGYDAQLI
ncbi:cation transporter [Entomospira nematocerorum]|uniref:Heavy-metal-associated domain-containing protein n=1 Tax=Entomospira nematocerorum TaxID=2719987 RepID=A0A968GCR8_9SPIO|nr:cation transporter [Entomospira nematocera]NIZ46854.1 heavy-metal-associated domain-containing protein [Entomospira nematocera]WDI33347.1 cation transporter [Entomospira nematocera]